MHGYILFCGTRKSLTILLWDTIQKIHFRDHVYDIEWCWVGYSTYLLWILTSNSKDTHCYRLGLQQVQEIKYR